MTVLPPWATDPEILVIDEDSYNSLPIDVQKRIEILDGLVMLCRYGTPEHSIVARRLANALEAARPSMPCTRVVTDVEMHYVSHRPHARFTFRRPDAVVYRCIERGRRITSEDVLLVVEVVSPASEYIDTVDKRAEYAAEGIPIYLVVHLNDELDLKIVQEYRLDWATRTYIPAQTHQEILVLTQPFPLIFPFTEIDA